MSPDQPEEQTPQYTIAPPGTKHDYSRPSEEEGILVWGQKEEVSPDSSLNNIAQLLAVQKEKDAAELERMKTDLPYFIEKMREDSPETPKGNLFTPDQMAMLRTLAHAKPLTMRFSHTYVFTIEVPREHYRVTSNYDVEFFVLPKGEIQIKYTVGHFKPVQGKLDAIVADIRNSNGFISQDRINDTLRGFYVHSRKGKRKRSHALRKRAWYASTNVRVFEKFVF